MTKYIPITNKHRCTVAIVIIVDWRVGAIDPFGVISRIKCQTTFGYKPVVEWGSVS